MSNVFNKIMKSQKNANEEAIKQQIVEISNQIMGIFIEKNCSVALIRDVLQTLSNHLDRSILNKNVKDIFKELPEMK